MYYLATKVGRYGETEFGFSGRRVTASVDESLRRLGVDTIDLIQCHDIDYGDLDRVVSETIPVGMTKMSEGLSDIV
jgi:L-galactose dehydrogenase